MVELRRTLTARRQAPYWVRRALVWAGVALGALVAGVLVAGLVMGTVAERQLREATWLLPEPPSARLLTCTTGPSEACAEKAARRVRLPVAWMSPPEGFAMGWFMAVAPRSKAQRDRAFSSEHLTSQTAFLELETQPQYVVQPGEGDRVVETTTQRGRAVRVIESDAPMPRIVALQWAKHGITYQLFVGPLHFVGDELPTTEQLVQLIDEIRYTDPPSGRTTS